MKILFVNKFLHLNGGSETYIYNLGHYLRDQGHRVEYFGMEHTQRCMGNRVNSYTSSMDFHTGTGLAKLSYSLKTIYSYESRKKIRKVLEDLEPDVCHLNNFNYQLTPSIILEIRKWQKENGKQCRIVFTAHDYQLLCPNHMFYNPDTHENCERCMGGRFYNCLKNKCIHGSGAKSLIGAFEGYFWRLKKVYKEIDAVICCSEFMKKKMDQNPIFSKKTIALHNFVGKPMEGLVKKQDYVLYFGRFSEEKGVRTLVKACKSLPDISFVFAGAGPLEDFIGKAPNIKNVGFQHGKALKKLIQEARFSVYPSEWYENCPFSVMESQLYGTPVLGADIGGIPELIKNGETGELFKSGNEKELRGKIREWWEDSEKIARYTEGCKEVKLDTISEYCEKLMRIYQDS